VAVSDGSYNGFGFSYQSPGGMSMKKTAKRGKIRCENAQDFLVNDLGSDELFIFLIAQA
jgi:hypothetical protein